MEPITLELLLKIHNNFIQDFPATAGMKNDRYSLLQQFFPLENNLAFEDCFESAAFLCYRIISEKPFNSLNKRMAIAIISLILNREGYEFTADSLKTLQFCEDIDSGLLTRQEMEDFIRKHST